MENRNVKKHKRKRYAILLTLVAAALAFSQGCGTKDQITEASSSGVPKTLNYGYIGTNALNVPGGAEGWGFH